LVKISARTKLWLTANGKPLIGEGGYLLLKKIEEKGSLVKAAEELGVSYSFAWRYLQRVEKLLGKKVVESHRGGGERGGTSLTPEGRLLVQLYERARKLVERSIEEFVKGAPEL